MPPRNQRKQSSPKTSKRNLSNARLLFWSAVPFPAQSVRRTHVIAPPRNLRKGPTSPRGGRRRGSPLHERASDLARAPPTRTTATTTEQRSACFLRGRENHLARRPCCHPPPRRVVPFSWRAAPPAALEGKSHERDTAPSQMLVCATNNPSPERSQRRWRPSRIHGVAVGGKVGLGRRPRGGQGSGGRHPRSTIDPIGVAK